MCAIDDYELWTVSRKTQPTARIAHRCVECWRLIPPGEKYNQLVGLCEGFWSTHRTCQHCTALGEWMNAMCGGWPIGCLYDELVEHWREGYASIPFGRLIACMRLKWHGGTDPVPEGMAALANSMMHKAVA